MQPWRHGPREALLEAPPWLKVFRHEVVLPDGRVVPDFYGIELPDFAVVAALTAAGEALAVEQYRAGPEAVTTGLPAGYLEPGEDALAAARRELLEETGYEAARWTPLGAYTVDGNRGCGRAHLYLAEEVARVRPPAAGDLGTVHVHLRPFYEIVKLARSGGIAELASVAAIGLAAAELAARGSRRPSDETTC